ncbi:MAG: formylglycine-generating enzyme family protein [Symploca sp. SIO2E9]|nr:formylglycine-generating enzyme family protein [Symploca sp. SIO2E9]
MEREQQQQQKLEQYRHSFSQAVEQEFPLTTASRRQLRRLQQSLQLTDKQRTQLEEPILTQKEAQYRKQQEQQRIRQQQEEQRLRQQREADRRQQQATTITTPTPITRKQFLKWAGLGGGGLVIAVVARQILDSLQIVVAKAIYIAPTEGGPKLLGLPQWSVEFETVKVNARGKEVERNSKQQAKFFKEELGNGISLEMVEIPGGSFTMGSPASEKGQRNSESPQQEVKVPTFFMGMFEVTQQQYQQVMGKNPSRFKGEKHPVERVSWNDAEEFCKKLSQKTMGRSYRLPSEAQWEYACRAGTKTPFHYGETLTDSLANYRASVTYASEPAREYREKTTPVGSFPANAFGLYDMHGNVWEWCADDWHANYDGVPRDGSAWIEGNDSNSNKVLRGGSWNNDPDRCRCASRDLSTFGRDAVSYVIGFRVVCVGARTT